MNKSRDDEPNFFDPEAEKEMRYRKQQEREHRESFPDEYWHNYNKGDFE